MYDDTQKTDIKLTEEEVQLIAEREEGSRFDNNGNEIVDNRATRRKRLLKPRITILDRVIVPSNKLTKATHSIKLARAKSKKAYRKTH